MMILCASALLPAASWGAIIGIDYDSGNLYQISELNASLALIGSTGIPAVGGLEMGPDGFLYGATTLDGSGDPALYRIDPGTAVAELIGLLNLDTIGLDYYEGALAFGPDGTLYATNYGFDLNPRLLTIDTATGQATVVGTMTGGQHDVNGLAWRSDGKLIGLDRRSSSLLIINPSDAVVEGTVASLSPTLGGIGGMTVAGDTAYFSTAGPGGLAGGEAGSNALYSVDLFTGAHQQIGSFSPGVTGSGIGGLAVPTPATLALMGVGGVMLVLRRRR
jgi:DNA-binding beta-propeller fold protein YncE